MRRLLLAPILLFVLSNLLFAGRYYDSAVGRFLQVDPLAEKYPSVSPYNYALDNPLKYIDPDGRAVTIVINRTVDNRITTMGTISITSDIVDNTFEGYTLEPSSSDPIKPKSSSGEYSAYQRATSVDGKKEYNPNRIHMVGVTDESGNAMPGAQIHTGNKVEDTDGCTLVGEQPSENSVGSSIPAMEKINSVIDTDGSGEVTVIINDPPKPEKKDEQELP